MNILNYLRDELEFLTVGTVPEFMKLLGGYNWDKILMGRHKTYWEIHIHEVHYYVSSRMPATHVQHIYFTGGPSGDRKFKGDLLTCVVDKAMYVSRRKGLHYVEGLIAYLKQTEGVAV
jgi:hypothetical protein